VVLILEIAVVAVVVFAAAGYVSGWIPGMQPTEPDLAGDNLPAGRLAPADVDRARFGLAFRGYRMSEVDAVLDRLRDQMARYEGELAELRSLGDVPVSSPTPPGSPPISAPPVPPAPPPVPPAPPVWPEA
jgi:DivIVA domain-containing protein